MSFSAEDKKCRICGYADTKNVNIFTAHNKTLADKIRTVFPILMYENDPLPKNICKKCTATVNFMHLDVQRVMKMQNKWIQNVRNIEPDNNYICILDMIESANRGTRQSIKTILHEDVAIGSIERVALALSAKDDIKTRRFRTLLPKPSTTTQAAISPKPNINNNLCPVKIKQEPMDATATNTKSQLALNGCSLGTVQKKRHNNANCSSSERDIKTRKLTANLYIKQESSDYCYADNEQGACSTTTMQAWHNVQNAHLSSVSPQPNTNCNMCSMKFKTANEMATHQLCHLRLQLPKLFLRKCLEKKKRRGRLITLRGNQTIRCLNCWRMFDDHTSILTHWTMKDCDFYCHICGKEFPHAPKMLREHVPAAHGITYRSAKMQHGKFHTRNNDTIACKIEKSNTLEKQKKPAYKTAETLIKCREPKAKKTSALKGEVPCPVCGVVFQNMQARNSHMRKHKGKKRVKPKPKQLTEIKTEPTDIYYNTATTSTESSQSTAVETIVPVTHIKTEPLDIDDIFEKCQVCYQFLTAGVSQHVCF